VAGQGNGSVVARTQNLRLTLGDLVGQGAGIDPINLEIFNRALEIGDHIDAREWRWS
jgi:hypothetical protein